MGMNNRARRAAKRRKRASARRGAAGSGGRQPHQTFGTAPDDFGGWAAAGWGWPGGDRRAAAGELVGAVIAAIERNPRGAGDYVEALVAPDLPVSPRQVADAVDEAMTSLLRVVVGGGWAPSDLAETVRRRLTGTHLPALAAALAALGARHPAERVPAAWLEDLQTLGEAEPADLGTSQGLRLALELCATFGMLPRIQPLVEPPGTTSHTLRSGSTGSDARALARVRALLAKAESTDFPDEAEALSAKAQELISRYSLDRLAAHADDHPGVGDVVARRVWIEAPYVLAKALLIDAVASANRCRTVVDEGLGFSTVIGAPDDLSAVELLSTSLLVQGNAAMLRCGRHADWSGTSRTTSFRRSFLMAYASRIRSRLAVADEAAMAGSAGGSGALVPLLARHQQRVEDVFVRLFPQTQDRGAIISNRQGWAAGLAAADLARLDGRPEVGSRAV